MKREERRGANRRIKPRRRFWERRRSERAGFGKQAGDECIRWSTDLKENLEGWDGVALMWLRKLVAADPFPYDYQGYKQFFATDVIRDIYCVKNISVISCNIRVITEPKVVNIYPGGLSEHIEKLWEKGERFDVTFVVDGESISAHRFMLAVRSPVFEAKLFGPMAKDKMECIKIDEMKVVVFKALLHFIYTNQLPIDESNDAERGNETLSIALLQNLLVAADRYGLEKLTLMCEEQLASNLSVDSNVCL